MIHLKPLLLYMLVLLLMMMSTGCDERTTPSRRVASTFSNGVPLPASFIEPSSMTRTFYDYSLDPPRVYHENVWVQSADNFNITCTAIFELVNGNLLPLSPEAVAAHNALLAQGQGYFSLFERGFRIRNIDLFLDNYNYSVMNPSALYLQREVMIVRILSQFQDRPNFTVWIDKLTGIVLKSIQDTMVQPQLTKMEVTQINLNPNLPGQQHNKHDLEVMEIGLDEVGDFQFSTFVPMYLPAGFQLEKMERVDLFGHAVFKMSFIDGIQKITISQFSLKLPNDSGMVSNHLFPIENTNLHVFNTEGFYKAIFDLGDTQFSIKGQVSEAELGILIESLKPVQ